MTRLAIISSHPIQYNAPLFKLLFERAKISVKVFYTWGEAAINKFDPGFNKNIVWDIPLLEGYEYSFVKNIAAKPGSHHFFGIDNPGLVSDIEAWKADAVLIYGWAFKSHLKAMRHFHKRIPVFFRGDSTLLGEDNAVKKWLRSIFLRWVYTKVDRALYVGTHNKKYFLKFGLKEEQLTFVPHAIDNDRFSDNDPGQSLAALEWRTKLNIGNADIVFLFAAKLDENKSAALLIESFKNLSKNNTFLVIAGNGDLEKQLQESCTGIHNICFLPFQNQSMMPVLYRLGDVFVLPSRSETWGLSINEAMACSRALLVSDTCGAAIDLVQYDRNGFVFESGNAADLKDTLQKCIDNKAALKAMGKASYQLIQDWSYENDAIAIENLLSDHSLFPKN